MRRCMSSAFERDPSWRFAISGHGIVDLTCASLRLSAASSACAARFLQFGCVATGELRGRCNLPPHAPLSRQMGDYGALLQPTVECLENSTHQTTGCNGGRNSGEKLGSRLKGVAYLIRVPLEYGSPHLLQTRTQARRLHNQDSSLVRILGQEKKQGLNGELNLLKGSDCEALAFVTASITFSPSASSTAAKTSSLLRKCA